MTTDIVHAVQDYVEKKLKPNEHMNPEDFRQEFIDFGFFRIGHSKENGGLGLSTEELIRIQMALGQTKLGFRNIFSTTTTLAAGIFDSYNSSHWLDKISNGTVISTAFTEPDKGSRTSINNGKITGHKRFISNAPRADYFLVYASGTFFVVSSDDPGVTVGVPWEKTGQEENPVADVYFNNAEPISQIGPNGKALVMAENQFVKGRLIVSAVCTGMAIRLCEEQYQYAVDRQVYGYQLVKGLIADSVAKTYAAKSMVLEASRDLNTMTSSATKLMATNLAGQVADNAVQVFGGYGYMRGHIVEQFFRDIRVFRLYEGTDQIQQVNIATQYADYMSSLQS